MARAMGSVTVVGRTAPMSSQDERVTRGTVFGNPFLVTSPSDRDEAIAAYFTMLGGEGGSVHEIARAAGLKVHAGCARVPLARRLGALRRLAARVASGESLVLRCSCKPLACHGDVVKEWVLRDAAALLSEVPS
jgi:hypothetical protein